MVDLIIVIEVGTLYGLSLFIGYQRRKKDRNEQIIKIKCTWKDYYDYRLVLGDGSGHVRVSFFDDSQIIISDLFVTEDKRTNGIATRLLDEADKIICGRPACITPLEEWQQKWYEHRGYKIVSAD